MTEQLKPHPIAEEIPSMTDLEYGELVRDVGENGLIEPIVMFEGMILDGRHRNRACDETGREKLFRPFTGTEEQAIQFVWSVNGVRRNLTEVQRAILAAGFANMRRGSQPSNASQDALVSQRTAAEMFNVSRASIQRAAKVLDRGIPELQAQVKAGKIESLATAAAIASWPKKEQGRILAKKTNGKIASYGNRIKVESAMKNAHTTFDLCLIDNASVPKTKTNIIAMQHLLALKLDEDGNPEAREGARYIRRMIEDWEETDVIGEIHDLEGGVFDAIRHCPQETRDLARLLGAATDEVKFVLENLERNGWVALKHQEGKTEDARGQKKTLWGITPKGQQEAERLREIHAAAA